MRASPHQHHRDTLITVYCRILALTALVFVSACSKDDQSNADEAAAAPQPTMEKVKADEAVSNPEAAKPVPPPVLDLVRKGDMLVLSGTLRSSSQKNDIVAMLNIDGFTLDNQLAVNPKTQGVTWGNRISGLLVDLVHKVTDLHFRIDAGVVTITGKVDSPQVIDRLQRDIAYTVEGPSINELKNNLEAISDGGSGGKGKGKGGKGKGKGGDGGKGKGSDGNSDADRASFENEADQPEEPSQQPGESAAAVPE